MRERLALGRPDDMRELCAHVLEVGDKGGHRS
jgi:hypothetical protein